MYHKINIKILITGVAICLLLFMIFMRLRNVDYESNECPVIIKECRLIQNDIIGHWYQAYLCCETDNVEYCEVTMLITCENDSVDDSKDIELSESESHNDKYIVRLSADTSGKIEEVFDVPKGIHNIQEITVYVSKAVDLDGNVWRNHNGYTETFISSDLIPLQEKPVQLCEGNLEYNRPRKEDYDLYVNWKNISPEYSILNVFLKIYGTDEFGKVLINNGQNCEMIIPVECQPDIRDAILPNSDNLLFSEIINNNDVSWVKKCSHIMLTIERAITTDGRIWINTNNEDAVDLILDGKKGYSFNEKYKTTEVKKITKELKESIENETDYGLFSDEPLVSMKESEYLILRYPQVDIMIGVDADGQISEEYVGIAYYNKLSENKALNQRVAEEANVMISLLLKKIYPLVLVDLHDEFVNDSTSSYSGIDAIEHDIDLKNGAYKTVFKYGTMLDSDGEKNLVLMEMIGKNLTEESIRSLYEIKQHIERHGWSSQLNEEDDILAELGNPLTSAD